MRSILFHISVGYIQSVKGYISELLKFRENPELIRRVVLNMRQRTNLHVHVYL
jgi:hypothetical protein